MSGAAAMRPAKQRAHRVPLRRVGPRGNCDIRRSTRSQRRAEAAVVLHLRVFQCAGR